MDADDRPPPPPVAYMDVSDVNKSEYQTPPPSLTLEESQERAVANLVSKSRFIVAATRRRVTARAIARPPRVSVRLCTGARAAKTLGSFK